MNNYPGYQKQAQPKAQLPGIWFAGERRPCTNNIKEAINYEKEKPGDKKVLERGVP
ncbi:hypothetical protein [Poritiphilus flavus]|uniref:Uncharacterized protein n=1 Tax=Poritiphilus flavus TaxID=2697053 RepID=A0A6L9EG77_9FLAO|nr:hypothetical protein [Poritiphilus flavus]NAS13691.1 hypothetical protein [Poritiphilus flavus]